jgi:hypothetical protein
VSTPRTAIVTSLTSSTFPSLTSAYIITGKMTRNNYLEKIVQWSVHSMTNIVMLHGSQDDVHFVISQTVDQKMYNLLYWIKSQHWVSFKACVNKYCKWTSCTCNGMTNRSDLYRPKRNEINYCLNIYLSLDAYAALSFPLTWCKAFRSMKKMVDI